MESNLYFGLLDLGSLASSPCGSKQWKLGYVGFLVYTGGGLDGCGVGVGVASLSDEQETMKDGILMGSFRVKDLHLGLIFLFFGKEDVIIG